MISKISGFCYGVQSAIDTARANATTNVYMYSDLVNNSTVMAQFRRQGFIVVENTNDIPAGATVILRAHGVPKAVYENLNKKGVTIIDCTCDKIKKIHEIVEEESANGKQVFIIGKKDHPEVVGICGWCSNATVLETKADLQNINWQAPICVVGQTTVKRDWWTTATAHILQHNPAADIRDTLCNVVTNKVAKAVEIARAANHVIVVGDKKSANSLEMYNTCAAICPNTVFVANLEEFLQFRHSGLNPESDIGLVGSASTPGETVEKIYDYLTFANFMASAKQEIDQHSDQYLQQLANQRESFIKDAVTDLYLQNQGGKRIRGTMIKLGELIAVGNNQNFLPIASAYEIFQTAILIHDDIIDRSATRRGKFTIHAKEGNPHFALSRAICIGDYGLFLANKIIANAPVSDATKVCIFRQFADVELTTLEGEILDVSLPYSPIPPTTPEYDNAVYQIYTSKTAWYTLAGPMMIGAICGNANDNLLKSLRDITLPLGIAFQIKDDLLGMYGATETLGKPATSDLEEKKQTILYGHACKHATPAQMQILDNLYGKQNATPQDLEDVRKIFTDTGARHFAEAEIRRLSNVSLELIAALQINDNCKSLLRGLVYYLIEREN